MGRSKLNNSCYRDLQELDMQIFMVHMSLVTSNDTLQDTRTIGIVSFPRVRF